MKPCVLEIKFQYNTYTITTDPKVMTDGSDDPRLIKYYTVPNNFDSELFRYGNDALSRQK